MVEATRSKPALCNAAEGESQLKSCQMSPPENRKCVRKPGTRENRAVE